ncbi:hypothetical protein C1I98_17560 [Spongiactinospora gelatinilytica]|uniref:Uncharacterized protein n=1 Tax=Spongiactinospora gelatinilytica TaxID=2666298 RepID=A0A2W2G2Q2_9ACTN|nr:hypothetical protein [Spongiactinospora gelatinilytica]PZG44206.1 hypothetical protein C1I98_17560 [Spongiactinospora gelatinilytica]
MADGVDQGEGGSWFHVGGVGEQPQEERGRVWGALGVDEDAFGGRSVVFGATPFGARPGDQDAERVRAARLGRGGG